MSREVVFVQTDLENFEVEDAVLATEAIGALEVTLRPYLDAEVTRLKAERDFLKEVYSGITQGSPLEGASTLYVDYFLQEALGSIFP